MPKPTAEEFASWILPRDALRDLTAAFGSDERVKRLVFDLVAADQLSLVAEMTTRDRVGSPHETWTFDRVAPDNWVRNRDDIDDDFWELGKLTFMFRSGYPLDPPTYVRHFNARFEPEGVAKLLATAPPKIEAVEPKPADGEETATGPRVTDPDLLAWFDLYKRVFREHEITLPHAWASARGMFQGKSVARDRIRPLLAGRKPGPKTKPADTE